MIVPPSIRRKFAVLEPAIEEMERRVRDTVSVYCDRSGFAYSGRRKALESLAEKIETGRFSSWSKIDDFFGCSIIIPTLDDEDKVLEFLRATFNEIETRRRGSTQKPPDSFRFDATRFIGRLRPISAVESSEPWFHANFEVQVRSAFEHAWSVTTHSIYKSHRVTWKTQRLAAQLKAVVEQLDSLVRGLEISSQRLVEHEWADVAQRSLIIDKFAEFATSRLIPDVLIPKDWSRFASNLHDLIKAGKSDRTDLRFRIERAIGCIERELTDKPSGIPLTLSLFQFAFAVISREGILEPPLKRFCPLITDELREFYPEISRFDPGFSFTD